VTAATRALLLETGRGWLVWILPGSMALHLVAVAVLPNAGRAPMAQAPVVIEMIDPPEPEPPPQREDPDPEQAAASAPTVARVVPASARSRAASAQPVANDRPADGAPVDFTSAVMSNEGSGMAIGSGGGGAGRGPGPHAGPDVAPPAPPAAAVEPRVVEAKDLSRRPRAQGLDATLEQHYPLEERRSGISGKAVLRVMILPSGRVGTVRRVEESRSSFAEACERAVRSARWEPPIDREGAPVATEITYTCRFEIRG